MKFLRFWPIVCIGLLVIILGVVNFVPGSILTGGDNLHPEFNLGLNIKRSLNAVWQEYQGPGLLGGMGHAADLVRQLLLFPLTVVLPIENVRYVWTILTLAIGGIGAYVLIDSLLKHLSSSSKQNQILALCGALFYILNLSTVQSYFTPFETFTSHFAALPWLLLTTVNYVTKPTFRNMVWLLIAYFLGTPQNYVPTIFVVTMLAVIILLPFILLYKHGRLINKNSILRSIKLFSIIILINAFWLLPFLLFTLTNSDVNVNSRINQMATETIYLQNKEFGNITNVLLLKGFWFNSVDTNKEGINNFMLAPWRAHLSTPGITQIGYILFSIILTGIIPVVQKRNRILLGFAALLLFAITMLTIATAPFSWFNELFRLLPLMNQAFRFPFTKFSILASLLYAVFFSFGLYYITTVLHKKFGKLSNILVSFIAIAMLAAFTFPVFRGNLFYEKAQVTIPAEYREMMDFFATQDPATRIANFPQHTFWSWNFYTFNYTGSGFIWYGIQQPILDRAFDPWSEESEGYFTEISQAIYAKDPEHFLNVLDKYAVTWLLVDNNITHPTAPKSLFTHEIKALIQNTERITPAWSKGGLSVYKLTPKTPQNQFVSLYSQLPYVNSSTGTPTDYAYTELGSYATPTTQLDYYYPFRTFPSNKITDDSYPFIEETSNSITVSQTLPELNKMSTLSIPSYTQHERIVPVSVYHSSPTDGQSTIGLVIKTPEIFIDAQKISGGTTDIVLFTLPATVRYPLQLRINESQQYTFRTSSYTYTNTFMSTTQDNYLVLSDADGKIIGSTTLNTHELLESGIFSERTQEVVPSPNSRRLSITYPKINDNYLNYRLNPAFLKPSDCNVFRNGENSFTVTGTSLTLTSTDDSQCSAGYSPNLIHDIGYILFIRSTHHTGRGIHVWVLNEDQGYAPLDFHLPAKKSSTKYTYFLPPQEDHGKAYSFHFDTISIGNEPVSNTLEEFSLYPIPYSFLSSIRLNITPIDPRAQPFPNVKRINEFLYTGTLSSDTQYPSTLVLAQSYNEGWNAYQFEQQPSFIAQYLPFVFGDKVKSHMKVNSWSNGWMIEESTKPHMVIMYTPQWLQYGGFMLFFCFVAVLLTNMIRKIKADN